jgi:hypothetical protein
MGETKKVLKDTEKKDSNLEIKKGAEEAGSDDNISDESIETTKEALSIPGEVSEQMLFNEPTSKALSLQNEAVMNSPEIIKLEKMRVFAQEVIKSGVSSFKKEADVIVVLVRGAELGLPYGVAVNNIFPINGKTGMSVHLHKALLQNAGVYFELVEDFVPVYNYGKQVEKKGFVVFGTTTATKVEGFQVSPAVVDRQTTYYFEREIKMGISGKIRTKSFNMSFRYSEAVQAGLTEKDVWEKYTRSLMKARAFSNGSTEIASDVIQGMYSINELAMEFNKDFTIDENLQETITISHEDIN